MTINLYSEPSELPPISFGGGVDYKNDCSQIANERACDMVNMINDITGSSSKRNGSKRYIEQAISSNPVTSIYRAYASTGGASGASFKKVLLATTWDGVYLSTGDLTPIWRKISGGNKHNQRYSFVTMNNKSIFSGQDSIEPVRQYDVINDSYTNLLPVEVTTETINVRGKYLLNSKNYLLMANCVDISIPTAPVYYPSRIYYSLLTKPSSFTVLRFIDFKADDGEEITGIWEQNGRVEVSKVSSIHELDFNVLNLIALGGDQSVRNIVTGFGVLAPRTLVTDGINAIFLAKDGIRLWDGGRKTRLNINDEARIISTPVEPIINRVLKAGTFINSVAVYYPKKQWYIFSYEDPNYLPRGKANRVLVFDFKNGEWYPFANWNIDSFATLDGAGDKGEILFGGSDDGYVYYADVDEQSNDSRKEIVLENMDSTSTWKRSTIDFLNVKEGSASMKLTISPSVLVSSMSSMGIFNFGNFYDNTDVARDDKLAFKVYMSSLTNINTVRIDLEVNDVEEDFDINFTSVTLSSNSFVGGNNNWTNIEIKLSDFPILKDWVSVSSESFSFANSFTFYGLRFVVEGTGDASLSFDDVRVVQKNQNPLKAFRLTKQFNFGTLADKRFRQIVINADKSADSSFIIDVFNNFGEFSRRMFIDGKFGKEIYMSGLGGVEGIQKVDSINFSIISATYSNTSNVFHIRPIVVDKDFLYGGDQLNDRIIKIRKDKIEEGVFASSVGSTGSGSAQFNRIYQIALDDDNLYICDLLNQRVKVIKKLDLSFVTAYGELGNGTTNFHNPTGIAIDERFAYVIQDGNFRIHKLEKKTGKFISSVLFNQNTIGGTSLAIDEKYLYVAYDTLHPQTVFAKNVILERRDKSDLALVNRVIVRPQNVSILDVSTYTALGDISVNDRYIYVNFSDNIPIGFNYMQKRLKSDFSLVSELKSEKLLYSVTTNGSSFNPTRQNITKDLEVDGQYIQLKFSDEDLDNTMKLYNQAFIVIPSKIRER